MCWGHVGAQVGRHPAQQPICRLGLGRPRLDRLVEDGIDVHATAAVRYARQNAEWFELGARLFDDFWFALLQLPGIEIPMQPNDLRNGVLARRSSLNGETQSYTPHPSRLYCCANPGRGVALWRIRVEMFEAIAARVGNCSDTPEHRSRLQAERSKSRHLRRAVARTE